MRPSRPVVALASTACLLISAHASGALPTAMGWSELPNTRLHSVCAAEDGFSTISGNTGCRSITWTWNGGVFDTKRNRMIIFGGGHGDYYGNEIYAINLNDQTVERITDPGLPKAPSSPCAESIANGTQPNSRHTYDGIEYMANVDRMYVFSGSLSCAVGSFGNDTWTFNFANKTWQKMDPAGTAPRGEAGMMTGYDPNTGLIFLHDRQNLFSYDFNTNRYTKLSTSQATLGYHLAATIDPKRKKFIIMGYDSVQGGGRVWSYDIGPGSNYQIQQVNTTGGNGIVGESYPGIEYDPVTDRILGWDTGDRNAVYSLNLDTRQWTVTSYSGGPAPVGNGTHGRFRYSPASGVFVLVNSIDDNVRILRHSNAPAVRPNPPSNVSAQ